MSSTYPCTDDRDWEDFPTTGDAAWDHVLAEVAHPRTVKAEYALARTSHDHPTPRVGNDAERSTTCPN